MDFILAPNFQFSRMTFKIPLTEMKTLKLNFDKKGLTAVCVSLYWLLLLPGIALE